MAAPPPAPIEPTQKVKKKISPTTVVKINFASGLFSGIIQAGLLNPWDRALYLSVVSHSPFLQWQNFKNPYQGFWQSVVQRTISGGTYFMLQAQMQSVLENLTVVNKSADNTNNNKLLISPEFQHFCVGTSAGMLNGMLLNQLASVKYHAWTHREGKSFWAASAAMYKQGGIRMFFKGCHVTGVRDMTFGCVYEVMRVILRPRLQKILSDYTGRPIDPHSCYFTSNMISAALATVASGPFNYVRSMQYATPLTETPLTTGACLKLLWKEVKLQNGTMSKCSYIQQRLRIGWGTARVGVGMAIGQQLFDWSKAKMEYHVHHQQL